MSVKVKEIDEQHQKLIVTLNKLHAGLSKGKGNEVMGEIFDDLTEYTGLHFETEEKYFDKFNYENSDEHKSEHKEFIQKLEDSKYQFEDGSLSISIELLDFLVEWIEDHLKGEDQKYVKCFNDNGLK